jgi:hypothetical protein
LLSEEESVILQDSAGDSLRRFWTWAVIGL